MKSANLQRAVYSALVNDAAVSGLVQSVYADHPQPDEPEDDSVFPYITIGNDVATTWDSHTFDGGNHLVQIDVWSRSNNFLETKDVADAIRDLLHHQPLTIAAADHVLTINENNTFTRDPDGHTKRGMCMYRIILTED